MGRRARKRLRTGTPLPAARPPRSRRSLLVPLGAGGVRGGAGGVPYGRVAGGSPKRATRSVASAGGSAKTSSTAIQPQPLLALQNRTLLKPECSPLKGQQWIYPIGPPVRGLPDI